MLFSDCKFSWEGETEDGKDVQKSGETGRNKWLTFKNDGSDDKCSWKYLDINCVPY